MNTNALFENIRFALHEGFQLNNLKSGLNSAFLAESFEESRMALDYMIDHMSKRFGVDASDLKRCIFDLFIRDQFSVDNILLEIEKSNRRRDKHPWIVSAMFHISVYDKFSRPCIITIDAIHLLKLRLAWEQLVTERALAAIRPFDLNTEGLKQIYQILEVLVRMRHE